MGIQGAPALVCELEGLPALYWRQRSNVFADYSKITQALSDANEALKLEPNDADNLYCRANVFWTAKGADIAGRLACLEIWVTERILESTSIRDVTHLSGARGPSKICRLFEISDAVREMRKLSHTPINKTMAVETLLWRWAQQ